MTKVFFKIFTPTTNLKGLVWGFICSLIFLGGAVCASEDNSETLQIFNQEVRRIIPSAYLIKWETNIPAASGAVYDTSSCSGFDYAFSAPELENATRVHTIAVWGLDPGKEYFLRPYSRIDKLTVFGEEASPVLESSVPGFVPEQCNYLLEYLKFGEKNNPIEVMKLQSFLKEFEGFENVAMSGFFDKITLEAVKAFQEKYKEDILTPWGIDTPTGYVYITTTKKINELYCQREFKLTEQQEEQIVSFGALVETVQKQKQQPEQKDFGNFIKLEDLKTKETEEKLPPEFFEEVGFGGAATEKEGLVFRILSSISAALGKVLDIFD